MQIALVLNYELSIQFNAKIIVLPLILRFNAGEQICEYTKAVTITISLI